MTTKTSTYPLRLPRSLKAAVEKLSKQDRTSVNQFVVMAVAEKVSAMTPAEYFAERKARAGVLFVSGQKVMRNWRPTISAEASTSPERLPLSALP